MSATQDLTEGRHLPSDDLPRAAWELVRHYARTRQETRGALEELAGGGADLPDLICRGLLQSLPDDPDGRYSGLLRALPELWWLDVQLGIHAAAALSERLDDQTVERIRRDSLALVGRLDRGARPAAWVHGPDLFTTLIAEEEVEEAESLRARVLARGVGLAIAMAPDWLAPALELVRSGPSLALLRSMTRDDVLGSNERWVSALLLRGGAREVGLGAATLLFAPEATRVAVRDLISITPPASLLRVADAHGLLTLAGDAGMEVAEALRTGFLTQVWQGIDLSGLRWADAFRGELLISRSLPELGEATGALARSVADGLVTLLNDAPDAPHADPVRRDAVAECLTWLLAHDAEYCAALRLTEAHLREIGRQRGAAPMGAAMRAYARICIATGRRLIEHDARAAARNLYARVLRLRKAHPALLPRDGFPDTLDKALHAEEPERAARRWVTLDKTGMEPPAETIGPDLRPTPEDPLPAAHEIVAAADALGPLPRPIGAWVGATRWSPLTLVGSLVPIPFRQLGWSLRHALGCTPKTRFVLSDDGRGALIVQHRLLWLPLLRTRRAIAGGRLFTFPEENIRADRMLGRWSALLIALATVGTWLALKANTDVAMLSGGAVAVFGLLGYMGALTLHRAVGGGNAVAVRDDRDQVTVWAVAPGTRLLIDRHTDKGQHDPVASISAPDPQQPSVEAHAV